jgi:hypothetical protein
VAAWGGGGTFATSTTVRVVGHTVYVIVDTSTVGTNWSSSTADLAAQVRRWGDDVIQRPTTFGRRFDETEIEFAARVCIEELARLRDIGSRRHAACARSIQPSPARTPTKVARWFVRGRSGRA